MSVNLVIPAAKYVSEDMGVIGKIPALLYPIGNKTVFDYIYDQYSKIANNVIIVGYEGYSKISNYINLDRANVELLKLDKLEDLAYTIYRGLDNIDRGDVFVNFSDTLVDEDVSSIGSDCFYCSEEYLSNRWTYFGELDGRIVEIIDKPEANGNGIGRMFVGVFKFSDVIALRKALEDALSEPLQTYSRFYSAVLKYSESHPLKPILTKRWFDLGHLDNYVNSKLEVKAREFNYIEIDRNRGVLCKTSEDKEKLIGEIKWYLKLPFELTYCCPRIFSYSTDCDHPSVKMEYYSYHTVHELYLYGDLSYPQWNSIFRRIEFVVGDFSKYVVTGDDISSSLVSMYYDKTIQRLSKISSDCRFDSYLNKPIVLNGVKYKPLTELIALISGEIKNRLCGLNSFQIIHGDLCFTNILIDENLNFVKLIDPRGKFGSYDIYGDIRYDLAKIAHSVDGGYDYIIKDRFELDVDLETNEISYHLDIKHTEQGLYSVFLDVFKERIGDQRENIEFIESLLFLTMIPLHNENFNHQLAMLSTSLQILDRIFDIRMD